jgi:segregation and condensation protein B
MDTERLKPIIEAAILASPTPISTDRLAELFDEAVRPTKEQILQVLHTLTEDCAQRGVELVEVASGFRYQIKQEAFQHLTGLWTERQSRYSRALLETLALIAYRQPITRGEIEQIRGVTVATSILRTLEEREWIRVVGHRDVPGRPALYGTTRAFLDYFGLRSLDELPPLSALRDLDTLEPELALDVDAPPPPVSLPLPAEDEPAVADAATNGDGAGDAPASGPVQAGSGALEADGTGTGSDGGTAAGLDVGDDLEDDDLEDDDLEDDRDDDDDDEEFDDTDDFDPDGEDDDDDDEDEDDDADDHGIGHTGDEDAPRN